MSSFMMFFIQPNNPSLVVTGKMTCSFYTFVNKSTKIVKVVAIVTKAAIVTIITVVTTLTIVTIVAFVAIVVIVSRNVAIVTTEIELKIDLSLILMLVSI